MHIYWHSDVANIFFLRKGLMNQLKSEHFSGIEYIALVHSQDRVLHIFRNLGKTVVFTHPKFI